MKFHLINDTDIIHVSNTFQGWVNSPAYGVQFVVLEEESEDEKEEGCHGHVLSDRDYYYCVQEPGGIFFWQTNDPWPWLHKLGLPQGLEKSDPQAFIDAGGKYGSTIIVQRFEDKRNIAKAIYYRIWPRPGI